MNIVPPVSMPNVVVQAASAPAQLTREERQNDLLMHQMIRATVEEGGQEKALLKFGDRKLWVESRVALRAGDQLSLQVVETHPELKLRILDTGLLDRLGRSLHLLGSRAELGGLLQEMSGGQRAGAAERGEVLQALLAGLKSPGEGSPPLQLQQLSRQLGLALERQLLSGQGPEAAASLKNLLRENLGLLDQQKADLLVRMQPLLMTLARLRQWIADPATAAAQTAQLPADLKQLVTSLLALTRAPGQLAPEQAANLASSLGEALGKHLAAPVGADGATLLRLQQVLAEFPALAAAAEANVKSLTHLEGPQRDLLAVLLRLVRRDERRLAGVEGEEIVRQMGRWLEQEVTGAVDRARERTDDALRHLELWQMCRARLAEIGVDFLPLPLSFLEQGYLLARKHQGADGGEGQADSARSWSLSLFLELEGLGPLQIDCLYQKQGLYLRFLCRDRESSGFLAAARGELAEALGHTPLLGASFAAGAEGPAQALIQRLIPAERHIFNARA